MNWLFLLSFFILVGLPQKFYLFSSNHLYLFLLLTPFQFIIKPFYSFFFPQHFRSHYSCNTQAWFNLLNMNIHLFLYFWIISCWSLLKIHPVVVAKKSHLQQIGVVQSCWKMEGKDSNFFFKWGYFPWTSKKLCALHLERVCHYFFPRWVWSLWVLVFWASEASKVFLS